MSDTARISSWVNIDLNNSRIENVCFGLLAAPPASPALGYFYFDTNLGYLRYYNGDSWENLSLSALLTKLADRSLSNLDPAGQAVLAAKANQAELDLVKSNYASDSYPQNPVIGQTCFRTDIRSMFTWDGSVWKASEGVSAAQMRVMEIGASQTATTTVNLTSACPNKDLMLVALEHTILDPSAYSLNTAGTVLTFAEPVDPGLRITLRWFDTEMLMVAQASVATDLEWETGTSTTKVPTVHQVRSSLSNTDLTNSPYATNRILEIPQDIKLEINNNSQLVLKAGSKIWYPDGFEVDNVTKKFSFVTIENDIISAKYGNGRSSCLVIYSFKDNLHIEWSTANVFYSGETQPEGNWYVWYDTSANRVKLHDGISGYDTNVTFPFCIMTENPESASGLSDGGIKSIDQVFNGFGYIGSTVFALPGVKVQQATGFDGNTTTSEIQTIPFVSTIPSAGNNGFYDVYLLYTNSTLHTRYAGHISFDADKSLVVDDEYPSVARGIVLYSYSTDSSGRITSFEPYTVDSIANSNASNFSQAGRSYLSGMGMPSSRHIDLTPGASGATYTAPANGWFSVYNSSGQSNSVQLYNQAKKIGICNAGIAGFTDGMTFVPAAKGDVVMMKYTGAFNSLGSGYFRFIYAQGEQ